MSYQLTHAQEAGQDDMSLSYPTQHDQESWQLYPFTVQLSPHVGLVMPLPLLDIATDSIRDIYLLTLGGRVDISLLYTRKWIWQHFDCFPKLGLLLKYDHIPNSNIDEKGYIMGSIIYIEPNYNHLDGWEVLPKAGIGVAYMKIPGAFSSAKNEEEEEGDKAAAAPDVEPFRKEASLNFLFDILVKYRITPHWQLYLSVGVDYLPELFKDTEEPDSPKKSRTLEIYTASLGCSYTFNPSKYNPVRKIGPKKSRVHLAWLSSFRKAHIFFSNTSNNTGGKQQDDTKETDKDKYYYIGGLHVQWTYQVLNNHALVLGSEWTKDGALKKEIEMLVKKENLQASFLVGHEFLWGKLTFGQYLGIYVLNNAPSNGPPLPFSNLLYARLGLHYNITDYLHIGTSLKIDLLPNSREAKPTSLEYTRINYIDFRIGYSF